MTETPLAGKTVLLVDNHPYAREAMHDLLELYGAEVVMAFDGLSGLEQARTRRPDLVLCDYMMEDMDGLEVLRTLRADATTAAIPFIAITVSMDPAIRERFLEAGADAFLIKVDDVFHLQQTIERVLRGEAG